LRTQKNIVLEKIDGLSMEDFFSCINAPLIKCIYVNSRNIPILHSELYLNDLYIPNNNLITVTKGLVGSVIGIPILSNLSLSVGKNIDRVVFIYDISSCGIPEELTEVIKEFIPQVVR